MKKILSLCIAASMTLGAVFISGCQPQIEMGYVPSIQRDEGLRVHAVNGSDDTQAWHLWQSEHDETFNEPLPSQKYFFLPTSADDEKADIYNAFSVPVSVNGVSIEPKSTQTVTYELNTPYDVVVNEDKYTLTFLKSNAEAAMFINNDNADGQGTDLFSYLNDFYGNQDKSRKAKADCAVVDSEGHLDTVPIKKIKGRGNTSWGKSKKSYNVIYEKPFSAAGMNESKKYSLVANYQDDSLSRNRFLYDLSDAVGIPYSSDSRYTDLYINGYYCGSYQLCEKIDTGKNSLVNDIKEEGYLNSDGTVKQDLPFLCVVDPEPDKENDYYVETNGGNITIKYPDIKQGEPGYEEVKSYVAEKYNEFYAAAASEKDLSTYGDIDSLTKVYLINELGKNWDAGVSSCYFVYKADKDRKYKFFGSPVWDYDNTLGNCTGVKGELKYLKVDDYTEYTGWWCRFKGGPDNIINRLSTNPEITAASKTIWFDKFVPAIEHFSGNNTDSSLDSEIYTSEKYYSLIKDSAEMNYTSGWKLTTSGWIADHSKLTKATFDAKSKTMIQDSSETSYNSDFKGMYDYSCDWFTSRAAWLSQELSK